MSRYKDFDAALKDVEPIEWTMNGKRYSIAGDPPAGPILRVVAEGRTNDPGAAMEILNALCGEENVEAMIDDGLGLRQLSGLIEFVMGELGFDTNAAETTALEVDEGNG